MGADIVAVEGQSLPSPMSFDGPGLGLCTTRDRYVRQMPGRLVRDTIGADNRRGRALRLNTPEQRIRCEKARSNICANAGPETPAFAIHQSLLGEERGLVCLAVLNHTAAMRLSM